MDISTLSLPELKNLLDKIPAEIRRREKQERANTLREIEKLAAERGFTLEELVIGATEKKVKTAVAPKYRSPKDANLTWTGRGRQPKWVKEALASGSSLVSLSI